jgi:hypothetical protein
MKMFIFSHIFLANRKHRISDKYEEDADDVYRCSSQICMLVGESGAS